MELNRHRAPYLPNYFDSLLVLRSAYVDRISKHQDVFGSRLQFSFTYDVDQDDVLLENFRINRFPGQGHVAGDLRHEVLYADFIHFDLRVR